LHITETYYPGLPLLQLDRRMTKTILRNLISNAIKYTPSRGSVAIHLKKSSTKLTPSSRGSLMIEISDTGYGIPRGQQKKIFSKLFRASNIKIKDTDGTGLGLYIVQLILERVGGRIRVTSEENKGSTFTVLLPLEGMRRQNNAVEVADV
jgi:signal transduction histidine kinase